MKKFPKILENNRVNKFLFFQVEQVIKLIIHHPNLPSQVNNNLSTYLTAKKTWKNKGIHVKFAWRPFQSTINWFGICNVSTKTSDLTNVQNQVALRPSSVKIILIGIRLPSMPHKSTGQSLNVLISGGRKAVLWRFQIGIS
jgi:hypothetical protein